MLGVAAPQPVYSQMPQPVLPGIGECKRPPTTLAQRAKQAQEIKTLGSNITIHVEERARQMRPLIRAYAADLSAATDTTLKELQEASSLGVGSLNVTTYTPKAFKARQAEGVDYIKDALLVHDAVLTQVGRHKATSPDDAAAYQVLHDSTANDLLWSASHAESEAVWDYAAALGVKHNPKIAKPETRDDVLAIFNQGRYGNDAVLLRHVFAARQPIQKIMADMIPKNGGPVENDVLHFYSTVHDYLANLLPEKRPPDNCPFCVADMKAMHDWQSDLIGPIYKNLLAHAATLYDRYDQATPKPADVNTERKLANMVHTYLRRHPAVADQLFAEVTHRIQDTKLSPEVRTFAYHPLAFLPPTPENRQKLAAFLTDRVYRETDTTIVRRGLAPLISHVLLQEITQPTELTPAVQQDINHVHGWTVQHLETPLQAIAGGAAIIPISREEPTTAVGKLLATITFHAGRGNYIPESFIPKTNDRKSPEAKAFYKMQAQSRLNASLAASDFYGQVFMLHPKTLSLQTPALTTVMPSTATGWRWMEPRPTFMPVVLWRFNTMRTMGDYVAKAMTAMDGGGLGRDVLAGEVAALLAYHSHRFQTAYQNDEHLTKTLTSLKPLLAFDHPGRDGLFYHQYDRDADGKFIHVAPGLFTSVAQMKLNQLYSRKEGNVPELLFKTNPEKKQSRFHDLAVSYGLAEREVFTYELINTLVGRRPQDRALIEHRDLNNMALRRELFKTLKGLGLFDNQTAVELLIGECPPEQFSKRLAEETKRSQDKLKTAWDNFFKEYESITPAKR